MIHAGPLPLNQLANRLTELCNSDIPININNAYQEKNRTVHSVEKKESKIIVTLTDFILSTNFEDKWALTKDFSIVCFENAVNEESNWKLEYRVVLNKYDFFVKPFKSSFIHIYAMTNEKRNFMKRKSIEIDSILCKLVAIRLKDEIVLIPLIHTLDQKHVSE